MPTPSHSSAEPAPPSPVQADQRKTPDPGPDGGPPPAEAPGGRPDHRALALRYLSAVPGAVAFGIAHAVLLVRFYPGLGESRALLGVAAALVWFVIDLGVPGLVGALAPAGTEARPETRVSAVLAVFRLYPFILLVPEYFEPGQRTFNVTTRNFLVLQDPGMLILAHGVALTGLAALSRLRMRLDALRGVVALLVAVHFVAYFFANQGEYVRVHVVRSVLEWTTLEGPWRQRILVPGLLQALMRLGLVDQSSLYSALFVLGVPCVLFAILTLADTLDRIGPGGFWLAVLAPLLLVFSFDVVYVQTLPELLFACLFLRLAWDGRFLPALVVAALGILNRESFAVFTLSYPLLAWARDGFRPRRQVLLQGLAFVGLAVVLRVGIVAALGPFQTVEHHLAENGRHLRRFLRTVVGTLQPGDHRRHALGSVYAVSRPLAFLASLPLVAFWFGWRGHRGLLVTTGVLYAAHLALIVSFGMLNEARVLFVLTPLVLATVHAGLTARSERPLGEA